MTEILLCAEDVARILQCSIGTAYFLLARGEIVSIRFGKLLRCTPESLANFIDDHSSDHNIEENSLPSVSPESKEKSGKQLPLKGVIYHD